MTGVDIIENARGLVNGMRNTNQQGPYVLILNAEAGKLLDESYGSEVNPTQTLRERLKLIPEIQEVGSDANQIGVCSISRLKDESQQTQSEQPAGG